MRNEIVLKRRKEIRGRDLVILASIAAYTPLLLLNLKIFFETGMVDEDILIFTALAAIAPLSALTYFDNLRRRREEDAFPLFLRDLAMSVRTGMDPAKALIKTADADYGPLTDAIRRMAVQISWGRPFEEVLEEFGREQKLPMIKRAVSIIIGANRAGGDIGDILAAVSVDAQRLNDIKKEVSSTLKTYVAIIYIAYFIFLGIVYVLVTQLLPAMIEIGVPATIGFYKTHFFWASMIMAVLSGLVAGKLGERSAVFGLKHSALMMLSGYIFFKVVIL
ncbi:MAG: hypothetical protein DRN91_08970 [Candidatus Alkanophagales archaeon]|nr:MAG: hypothetical protein DRN91_08970 [Candidatus Alkanophagales archaeon]